MEICLTIIVVVWIILESMVLGSYTDGDTDKTTTSVIKTILLVVAIFLACAISFKNGINHGLNNADKYRLSTSNTWERK